MKHLSIRLLAICLILPPVAYLLGIYTLESWARKSYAQEIRNVYLGDTAPLLSGEKRLRDAVHANIERFLHDNWLVRAGMAVEVTVATESGVLLYPAMFTGAPMPVETGALAEIARENFKLLNERPSLRVEVGIGTASPLSVGLLLVCLSMGMGGLACHYRRSLRYTRELESASRREMDRLLAVKEEAMARLTDLEAARVQLAQQLERAHSDLENEKLRASNTEEQMIGELVAVEEKLTETIGLQKRHEEQIDTLRQEIRGYEQAMDKNGKRKQKDAAALLKRFNALYKNLSIQERAARGFADLTDEMKIKAEEIIHLLNDEPDKVIVKRKVFGKKTSKTAFEVDFAYKGRLYYRRTPGMAIEVLTIGTKNSQERDLGYLERL
jgi:hypothetical protein